jgi:ParB family transcriptional regulator, chromosome partitioning protein
MTNATERQPKAATTTRESDLERLDRVHALCRPFALIELRPTLGETEKIEVDTFLDECDLPTMSNAATPSAFWKYFGIPGRCFPAFRNDSDAKALLATLARSSVKLLEWIGERSDPSPATSICAFIELPAVTETKFGTVYCEEAGEPSIWFGRKAGQLPALQGAKAIEAAWQLFNCYQPNSQPKPEKETTYKQTSVARSVSPKSKPKEKPLIAEPQTSLEVIDIDCIQSDPENDRKTFDKELLESLAANIKQLGVLQPILLKRIEQSSPPRFVIVAGERRWRAAKIAGLKEIPAQITDRDGLQTSLARLAENLQRVDLSPIEKANGLKSLMEQHGLTQKEVGEAVGVQQGQISNTLRLLNLPDSLQSKVASGVLAPTLIRSLLPFADVPLILSAVEREIDGSITIKRTINTDDVEHWLLTAIYKHSRSMKDESKQPVQPYSKPSRETRYFATLKPADKTSLDIRELKGDAFRNVGARAFNVAKFDELNRDALQERTKKHNELKKKQQTASSSQPKDKSKSMFSVSSWSVESLMSRSLTKAIVPFIVQHRDKAAVLQVCFAVALSEQASVFETIAGQSEHKKGAFAKILPTLACSSKERDEKIRQAALKEIQDPHFSFNDDEAKAIADLLSIDLAATWIPSTEFFNALSDDGRKACAAAIGSDATTAAQLEKQWIPGTVPDFVRPLLGLTPPAKTKTAKRKAA